MNTSNPTPHEQYVPLLATLQQRFDKHMHRHPNLLWDAVQAALVNQEGALRSLHCMESTGGAPDVLHYHPATDRYWWCDCAPESPLGRRSLCYDPAALATRKENKPAHSAVGMAHDMGVSLLTEEQYRHLQSLQEVDIRTSSWIATPPDIRALDGALFADRRYGHVFVYHNGAESYYASRGFRAGLWV